MKYRIVKRVHKDESIDDEYVVQCLDKHDDWYSYWPYHTLKEAEEYVAELMSDDEEEYVETVIKEYRATDN